VTDLDTVAAEKPYAVSVGVPVEDRLWWDIATFPYDIVEFCTEIAYEVDPGVKLFPISERCWSEFKLLAQVFNDCGLRGVVEMPCLNSTAEYNDEIAGRQANDFIHALFEFYSPGLTEFHRRPLPSVGGNCAVVSPEAQTPAGGNLKLSGVAMSDNRPSPAVIDAGDVASIKPQIVAPPSAVHAVPSETPALAVSNSESIPAPGQESPAAPTTIPAILSTPRKNEPTATALPGGPNRQKNEPAKKYDTVVVAKDFKVTVNNTIIPYTTPAKRLALLALALFAPRDEARTFEVLPHEIIPLLLGPKVTEKKAFRNPFHGRFRLFNEGKTRLKHFKKEATMFSGVLYRVEPTDDEIRAYLERNIPKTIDRSPGKRVA
jgi:hypothetical protein